MASLLPWSSEVSAGRERGRRVASVGEPRCREIWRTGVCVARGVPPFYSFRNPRSRYPRLTADVKVVAEDNMASLYPADIAAIVGDGGSGGYSQQQHDRQRHPNQI